MTAVRHKNELLITSYKKNYIRDLINGG